MRPADGSNPRLSGTSVRSPDREPGSTGDMTGASGDSL